MKRWEETQPVSRTHGLFQVTRLIQQLLDGVVALHGAAFNHLHKLGTYLYVYNSSKTMSTVIAPLGLVCHYATGLTRND